MMVSSRIENCHLSRSQACKMVSEATSQRGERFSIQYGEQPPRNLSRASHNGIPLPLTEGSIATREKRATIQAWLETVGAEAESDLAGASGGQIRFSRSRGRNAATH